MSLQGKRTCSPFLSVMRLSLFPVSSVTEWGRRSSPLLSATRTFVFSKRFSLSPRGTVSQFSESCACNGISFSSSTMSERRPSFMMARSWCGPMWMTSPSLISASSIGASFSSVILFCVRFLRNHLPSRYSMTACWRETSISWMHREFSCLRPMVNGTSGSGYAIWNASVMCAPCYFKDCSPRLNLSQACCSALSLAA